jgi:hypothetical protein
LRNAVTMNETVRKRRCRILCIRAIKFGIIKRPDYCHCCYAKCRVDSHHESYDAPLDVQWLCRSCHKEADKAREARLGIIRKHTYHAVPQSTHDEANRLWATGRYSQVVIGKSLGIHNSTVSLIVRGLTRPYSYL